MSVFDGMPDIFTSVFGEPVDYTPNGGATRRIQAIWWETTSEVPDVMVSSDAAKTTLSVKVSDLTPAEDDIATRVSDGKTMTVTTPIIPDGQGVIVCNLAPSA